MELWIRDHFYDFENDSTALRTLRQFISNNTNSSLGNITVTLHKLIGDKLADNESDDYVDFNPNIKKISNYYKGIFFIFYFFYFFFLYFFFI